MPLWSAARVLDAGQGVLACTLQTRGSYCMSVPVQAHQASERELAGRSLSAVGDSPKMSHCGWHAATVGGRCLAVGFSHVMRRCRREVVRASFQSDLGFL